MLKGQGLRPETRGHCVRSVQGPGAKGEGAVARSKGRAISNSSDALPQKQFLDNGPGYPETAFPPTKTNNKNNKSMGPGARRKGPGARSQGSGAKVPGIRGQGPGPRARGQTRGQGPGAKAD